VLGQDRSLVEYVARSEVDGSAFEMPAEGKREG